MNPSPAVPPPLKPPRLNDRRVNPPVPLLAAVVRGFPPDRLAAVERAWAPARSRLARRLTRAGLRLEHSHWQWTRKDAATQAGDYLLAAVECDRKVQGLMGMETRPRPSRLTAGGWVLYVDYIESAPWNLAVPGIQEPRFSGVGMLLLAEAVRTALGRRTGCRVGLHSLPQSEDFYERTCRMTRVGPDPAYHDLVYFEYPDGVAVEWLTDKEFSV